MTTMERRDFILSIIATGLSASLAPMALARTLDPSLPLTPRTSPEPPDFGTVDIQLLLAGIFPERNLVITDQYAGVQIEILYLGLRRLEQFRALLERNRDYAVSMDQGMVARIVGWNGPRPDWMNDGIVRRAKEAGVFLTHVGLARTVLIRVFGDQYRLCDIAMIAKKIADDRSVA